MTTVGEYKALRNEVGLIDLSSAGKIKVTGDDHVEFVNSIITMDIEFMDIEKSTFSLILDEDAKVIDLVTVYINEDDLLIETSPAKRQVVLEVLENFQPEEELDYVIEDVTEKLAVIAFEGPYAWKAAQAVIDDIDITSLGFQAIAEAEWNSQDIMLARVGVTGEYGYKIFLPTEKSEELYNELLNVTGDEYKITPVSQKALEIAMLEVRQPNIEIESKGLTVLESCFEWLINFDKETFIGYDAIQDMIDEEVPRRIVGFSADSKLTINPKDVVQVENIKVGEILQAEYNPIEDKYFGLVILEKDFAVSGLTLESVEKDSGETGEIQTISSPFIVTKSLAIKMN